MSEDPAGERGRAWRCRWPAILAIGVLLGMLPPLTACAPSEAPSSHLPPPPDADLRPFAPPRLDRADGASRGDPGDYPALISALLAQELSVIFDLPEHADAMVPAGGDRDLLPTFDAVAEDIVIPMVFDSLDHEQQASVAAAGPVLALGERKRLYRLIVDLAMARLYQTAAGDASGEAGYLRQLAARPADASGTSFIAWRGLEGAVWKRRIASHLKPLDRPFAVLGLMASRYLHTHVFSILGYLVARDMSTAMIAADAARSPDDIERLTASLMDQAMLPLMGVDSLFAIAGIRAEIDRIGAAHRAPLHDIAQKSTVSAWRCLRWHFFDMSSRRLASARQTAPRHAESMAARLREEEGRAARRLSAFLPGPVASPVRFAGMDEKTWAALAAEPAGCVERADKSFPPVLAMTPEAESRRPVAPAQKSDDSCESILERARAIEDRRQRATFCQTAKRSFPDEAVSVLLAHIARGRMTEAERSALVVGLGLRERGARDGDT